MARHLRPEIALAILLLTATLDGCGESEPAARPLPATNCVSCDDNGSCVAATSCPPSFIAPIYGDVRSLYVRVFVDGAGPFLMRYDTGAPFSALDERAATDAGVTEGKVSLSVEEYPIGERTLFVMELNSAEYEYPELPGGRVHGTVGNDFFHGFAVGLHFQKMEMWLTPLSPGATLVSRPHGVGDATSVAIGQPADYLVGPCAFGSSSPVRECLLDTGSPEPLSFESYWSTLAHPSSRIVPFLTVDWAGTPLSGYFQRADEVTFGDVRVPGVHVSVFDRFEVLEEVVAYLQRDIVGLVGLAAIRQHFTVFDYVNGRLMMFRYDDQSFVPDNEFVGFGIVFGTTDGYDLFVERVVPESNAHSAGVQAGDVLLEVDGTHWWYRDDIAWTVMSFLPGELGESHVFTFQRAGAEMELTVSAEDLLPPIE